jgi:hypothetical protein
MTMKRSMVVGAITAVAVWLGLWITSTGLLVYSSNTRVPSTRDCRYLVGVTVQKRLQRRTHHCQFFRTVRR